MESSILLNTFVLLNLLSCALQQTRNQSQMSDSNDFRDERNSIKNSSIRILQFNSPGIKQDAEIINEQLKKLNKVATISEMDILNPHAGSYEDVALNIFLEKINTQAARHGRKNWIIVNPEFLEEPKAYRYIDRVLCKYQACVTIMSDFRKRYKFQFTVHYIGFTSKIIKNIDIDQKDYNLFFHPAGKSGWKQTSKVLDAWRKNSDFPKLILTCVDANKEADCAHTHLVGENTVENLKKYDNIKIYTEYLPNETIETLHRKAGVVVAPSEVEGFGHYINEAKGQGAIVVTTDYPPMNELIRNDFGYLLKSTEHTKKGYLGISTRAINYEDLATVVRNILALEQAEKKKLSIKSMQSFQETTEEFELAFKRLFEPDPTLIDSQ
jgi:glycosyltransferase involved in cell wall biosynthesis